MMVNSVSQGQASLLPGARTDAWAPIFSAFPLSSGTLAPLASFSHELQLPFKESIENPHVVGPSQVWLGVLPVGPSNVRLNSSYKSRNLPEYKKDLGNAIANFARVVPDGLL